MPELPVLIDDGDCGFCTRSARLVERLPVRVVMKPWQETDLAALRTTEARARREVLWGDTTGRVSGGSRALAELFKHCRSPWPVLGWAISAPVARNLADWAYRWVAANRYRLPGSTPACQRPADQRPGAGG